MDDNQHHHVVPASLLEPPAGPLFLQPSFSDESIMSISNDDGAAAAHSGAVVTMTSSGAIVTTASSQSRRHSSAVPFQVVTPSRRPSMHDSLYPHMNSTNHDRVQALSQQVLALHVTFGCYEEQTREWQSNCSHALEVQLEKLSKYEQAILYNQETIQKLREKITLQENLRNQQCNTSSSFSLPLQTLTLAVVAMAGYTVGRLASQH